MSFFNELNRRNVFKAGIACVAIAWLLAQVLQLVFEGFGTPGWVMKTMLLLLATVTPFAPFFAWAAGNEAQMMKARLYFPLNCSTLMS